MLFLVSQATLDRGANQWTELAYADAFDVPIFILLHHMTLAGLRAQAERASQLLLESQCNPSIEWRRVVADIRARLAASPQSTA